MRVWDTSHLLDTVPAGKRPAEQIHDYTDNEANRERIRLHFRQLQTRLVLGLLLGFLLPNALLSAYFHFQFTHTLKNSALLNLEAVAENQKNTIDLYLQERVVNLFNLFHSREFSLQPTQEAMDNYLQSLKRFHDGFIDVGFFNARGIQIGYAGPHPQLRGRDYSEQPWFRDLREGSRNYLISDIYTGLRNIPHFTIAVRQVFGGKPYSMRATLDPDKLYVFLRSISHGKEVETTLINTRGQHQVGDPGRGPFPSTSSYGPPAVPAGGVEEIEFDERATLIAYSWLKETPWALLVMQPASVAQSGMYRARLILTISLALISLLVSLVIFLTIRKVVADARKMAEKGQQL